MKRVKDYGVILFVEGDTEEEFYHFMLAWLGTQMQQRENVNPLIIKNLHGIGGFKRVALRYFINTIIPKYQKRRFYIVLAYDTDVFEYSAQPPVDWEKVDEIFRRFNAIDVIHIKQRHMIEDWFLGDLTGLCNHLELPEDTPLPEGKDGNQKMQRLFNQANRLYYKGHYTKRFLDELDMEKIYNQQKEELQPLVKLLFYAG